MKRIRLIKVDVRTGKSKWEDVDTGEVLTTSHDTFEKVRRYQFPNGTSPYVGPISVDEIVELCDWAFLLIKAQQRKAGS